MLSGVLKDFNMVGGCLELFIFKENIIQIVGLQTVCGEYQVFTLFNGDYEQNRFSLRVRM